MGTIALVLISLGIGAIVGLIVNLAILGIKSLISRLKQKHAEKVAVHRAKEALARAMEIQLSEETAMSLDELESLIGQDSIITAAIDDMGKVDADSIEILKADKVEDDLTSFLDQKQGCTIVACA